MKFSTFCDYLARLEKEPSRLKMTEILASLIAELHASECQKASYLLIGSLRPSYEGVVFQIAEKQAIKAIAEASGKGAPEVLLSNKKAGDLGDTAFNLLAANRGLNLGVLDVYEKLFEISESAGEGSVEEKIGLFSNLLRDLNPTEAKYSVRIVLGKLRLGFSEKTIIDALSFLVSGDKSLSSKLQKIYEVVPDIGELVEGVVNKKLLDPSFRPIPKVGVPVLPMLCQRIKSPTEMIKKLGKVSIEPKFDGLRVLIHIDTNKNICKAFTRNLKEISSMFPELLDAKHELNATSVILDSEAIGMDPVDKKMADFQTTMKRRRKHEIPLLKTTLPITFQVFDILFKDGVSLMDEKYEKRREILSKTIINQSQAGTFRVDENIVTDDPSIISNFHTKFRSQGLEGIIVKKLDSKYVPGRLGYRWVKMKESEKSVGKLSDTVDVVVMGFTSGKGKRSGFGMGQFLAGIVDGEYVKTITKVGTGLTDEQFISLNKLLSSIKLPEKPKEYMVHKNLEPDFWVSPKIVVELAADDITVSPTHTAGYALRFPRLVKLREDKSVAEATTLTEVKKLFKLQNK